LAKIQFSQFPDELGHIFDIFQEKNQNLQGISWANFLNYKIRVCSFIWQLTKYFQAKFQLSIICPNGLGHIFDILSRKNEKKNRGNFLSEFQNLWSLNVRFYVATNKTDGLRQFLDFFQENFRIFFKKIHISENPGKNQNNLPKGIFYHLVFF
jgi:hypothetical protein